MASMLISPEPSSPCNYGDFGERLLFLPAKAPAGSSPESAVPSQGQSGGRRMDRCSKASLSGRESMESNDLNDLNDLNDPPGLWDFRGASFREIRI